MRTIVLGAFSLLLACASEKQATRSEPASSSPGRGETASTSTPSRSSPEATDRSPAAALGPRVDLHAFRARTKHTNHCGKELWDIKTAADPQAGTIDRSPKLTTIAELVAKPEPAKTATRIKGVETTVWKLNNVTLLEGKQEGDQDYHLVLSDGQRTMIAEIPDPVCVSVGSVLAYNISVSRAAMDSHAHLGSSSWTNIGEEVTIAGVGFFDFGHGPGDQRGAAPNEIELHPVLDICFGHDCDVGDVEVAERR